MLDVDFCFIYLIKSKFNQIDRNLISYVKQTVYPVFCCSQYTVKTLYNVTRYNRIFNIRHKITGNGSVSIKTPSL